MLIAGWVISFYTLLFPGWQFSPSLLNQTIKNITNSVFYCCEECSALKPLSHSTACSERSLWLLITHCAWRSLKKQLPLVWNLLFSHCCRADVYIFSLNSPAYNVSDTPLTMRGGPAWSTQKSTLIICLDQKRVWSASLPLFNPPFPPRLFWTTQLSPPDVVLYCKEAHNTQACTICVFSWGCVCARVCPCAPLARARQREGEFDICKLNSAQTWQWWSVVHSSSDCLYLRFCPRVLQRACLLHRPQPRHQLAHLLMTVLENQIHTRYMFYQLKLAGGEALRLCLHPPRCVLFCFFSLHLFLLVRSGVLSPQASF